uniref:FRIGIDA-like protein n=1 Tax=Picea sitchensis TaxID=3332 RepID=A9NWA8_PICSI|nr:unknown [Picea sitchensis]
MSIESSISAGMDAIASKKERLHKAFLELQSHSSSLVNFNVKWEELEDHFNELEKVMKKRFEELGQKGKEELGQKGKENEKEKKPVAEKSTGKTKKTSEKKSAAGKSTGKPKKTSEKKSAAEKNTGNPKESSDKNPAAEKSVGNPKKTTPALKDDVKPRPELKSLCEKMDGEGLKKFLADSRSEVTELRNEVPAALRCAPNPAKLVLQTLEGFHPFGLGKRPSTNHERVACDLLLESLPFVLSPDEVSEEERKDAQKIAAAWKPKLNLDADSPFTIVRAHAFLQLLVSYGISKEFEEDDLLEIVLRIARHPKVNELIRELHISHKVPDIVEKLSSTRKQLDAAQFVLAFGLEEKFPPVPLLKAYLENEKEGSEKFAKKGGAQIAAASKEIASLNSVIKLIEEHKLESQMSSKDLEKRVAQLEKVKAERKRFMEDTSSQPKRPRLSSGAGADSGAGAGSLVPKPSPPSAFALSNSSALLSKPTPPSAFALSNSSALLSKPTPPSAFALSNSSDLHRPAPVASIPPYNLLSQGVYDRGSQGIHQSAYDVGSNPSSLSRSHLYPSGSLQSSLHPSDSLQSSLYGVGSFRGSTNYGSYNIGSGVPPTTSYQSSYLR